MTTPKSIAEQIQTLVDERERLMVRVAEIDAALAPVRAALVPPSNAAPRAPGPNTIASKALLALSSAPSMRLTDIARAIGASGASTHIELAKLIAKGFVCKLDRGIYALPERAS